MSHGDRPATSPSNGVVVTGPGAIELVVVGAVEDGARPVRSSSSRATSAAERPRTGPDRPQPVRARAPAPADQPRKARRVANGSRGSSNTVVSRVGRWSRASRNTSVAAPTTAARRARIQLHSAGESGLRAVVYPPRTPNAMKPTTPMRGEIRSDARPSAAAISSAVVVMPGRRRRLPHDPSSSMLSATTKPGATSMTHSPIPSTSPGMSSFVAETSSPKARATAAASAPASAPYQPGRWGVTAVGSDSIVSTMMLADTTSRVPGWFPFDMIRRFWTTLDTTW